MKLTLYQVDAFTDHLFGGNPAAVIPLEKWIPDQLMQHIANENNLAETVFFVPEGNDYSIRWFTPETEINLCGHATLASAFVLFEILGYPKETIIFHSKSGPLRVNREGEVFMMDFPSWMPEKVELYPEHLLAGLGHPEIAAVYQHRDYLVEFLNEESVLNCNPDFSLLKKLDRMVIITSPGKSGGADFVSRFFGPTFGVDEDSVTGSAHSQLIPFWHYKLNKSRLLARQLSKRGGELYCEQKNDRVIMGGKCVFYMQGELRLP